MLLAVSVIAIAILGANFYDHSFDIQRRITGRDVYNQWKFQKADQFLSVPGNQLVNTRWSVISRVDLVSSSYDPYARFRQNQRITDLSGFSPVLQDQHFSLFYDNLRAKFPTCNLIFSPYSCTISS